ncbi:hypothetical protein [Streptomyces sp. NPDC058486]|uniref:hypothetical protein n=1 Tax=unclassified Streptomyces TaxID=2593676 RepID=UPI003646B138
MTAMTNVRTTQRRPVLGKALVLAGLLLPVAQLAGYWVAESTRLLVLLDAFGAAWPYWLVMCALVGAGVLRMDARRSVRQAVAVACAAGAVLVLFYRLVFFDVVHAGWEETQRIPAPGGVDRSVRVEEGSAMIDPLWRISVIEGSGLTARSHLVASYGEPTGFVAVGWSGPDALELSDGDGMTTITLDPATGAPHRTLGTG